MDPRQRGKNCPSMGERQRRIAYLLSLLLALRRLDREESAPAGGSCRQATVSRDPELVACDANMCPEDFEKSLERSIHVQVERPKRCVDRKNV